MKESIYNDMKVVSGGMINIFLTLQKHFFRKDGLQWPREEWIHDEI